MKQRIVSHLLIVTIIASLCLSGAITRVSADQPSTYSDIYWGDIKDYVESLTPSNTNNWSYNCNQFFSFADDFIGEYEGPDPLVYCLWDSDGSILLGVFSGNNQSNTGNYYAFNWLNYSTLTTDNQTVDRSVSIRMILYYDHSSNNGYLIQSGLPSSGVGMRATAAFNFSSPNYTDSIPSVYNFNVVGRKTYVSRDIVSANKNFESNIGPDWGMNQNISATPLVLSFSMISFSLGERKYIAIQDQSLMNQFNTESDEYWTELYFNLQYANDPNAEIINMILFYDDFVRLNGIQYFVPELNNVQNNEVLAFEITNYVNADQNGAAPYTIMDSFQLIGFGETAGGGSYSYIIGQSESVLRFNVPDEPKESDSQEDAWQKFAELLSTYNNQHIVPENLPEYFFGENGGKLYPCTITMSSLLYTSGNNTPQVTAPNINTISWGFGPSYSGSMYKFDLMDVVIIPNNVQSVYQIRYFYDDTLSSGDPTDPLDGTYSFIDYFEYQNLMNEFDVILIVPEDYNILHGASGYLGYTGSGSQGIQYTSNALTANILNGFCFVTKRAIQKQQLYNFNEGIDTFYDSWVQYLNKRDDWDDSWLIWASSTFDMLNSIDGRLGRIGNILDSIAAWNVGDFMADIVGSLERIADNTSESDHGHWYDSLWAFVIQFVPTDNDFSAGINEIEDTWDDLPLLSPVSPAPTYPVLPGE